MPTPAPEAGKRAEKLPATTQSFPQKLCASGSRKRPQDIFKKISGTVNSIPCRDAFLLPGKRQSSQEKGRASGKTAELPGKTAGKVQTENRVIKKTIKVKYDIDNPEKIWQDNLKFSVVSENPPGSSAKRAGRIREITDGVCGSIRRRKLRGG